MDYGAELLEENRAFGELVLGADQETPVPTCPGMNLGQLFRHVGRGEHWAAQMVVDGAAEVLDPRQVADARPPADPEGASTWLHAGSRKLVDAAGATPDVQVWTFLGPRPASWWVRRRLHEVLVHRADAALALGAEFNVAPQVAADGLSEWLDIAVSRVGDALGERTVHLHATDDGLGEAGEWTITGTSWTHDHRKGDVALRGPARDLLLAATRRLDLADTAIEVFGDESVWRTWLASTPF